jgi:hypothetical protein
MYTPIRCAFLELFDSDEVPHLEERQLKHLSRLANLEPETFVDWYSALENELLMSAGIGLLPFDAITINYR